MLQSKLIVIVIMSALFMMKPIEGQFAFDASHDYFFESGQLQATNIGQVTNFLAQLVNIPEKFHRAGAASETLNSIAQNYYGMQSFAIMIARANNHINWNSLSSIVAEGTFLRLPSVVYCTQFVGIDCLLQSYRASQGAGSSNYWKSLPMTIQSEAAEFLSYPNYVYLVMSLAEDKVINPSPQLTMRIVNLLDYDLIEGQIALKTGYGEALQNIIPSNEEMKHFVYRSDLLQGIHGSLSYEYTDTRIALTIDFHVYSSNGTFQNSMAFRDDTNNYGYVTSFSGVKEISVGPNNKIKAQVSITASPEAFMTIILFTPRSFPEISGIRKIVPYFLVNHALEARWNETGYYRMGAVPKTAAIYQGWEFVPLNAGSQVDNRYLILNANSSFALQVNSAAGNVTLGTPNKNNINQIWKLIPSALDPNTYYIKGAQNLCMFVHMDSRLPRNNNIYQHMLWLEPCLREHTVADQRRMNFYLDPFSNFSYDL